MRAHTHIGVITIRYSMTSQKTEGYTVTDQENGRIGSGSPDSQMADVGPGNPLALASSKQEGDNPGLRLAPESENDRNPASGMEECALIWTKMNTYTPITYKITVPYKMILHITLVYCLSQCILLYYVTTIVMGFTAFFTYLLEKDPVNHPPVVLVVDLLYTRVIVLLTLLCRGQEHSSFT